MAATLTWSARALRDLEDIFRYIAADSPRFAAISIARIRRAIQRAAAFPESGSPVLELENPSLRQVFWHHYRIVYHIAPDKITVITIVHGARRFPVDVD